MAEVETRVRTWRALAIALAVACVFLWFRGRAPRARKSDGRPVGSATAPGASSSDSRAGDPSRPEPGRHSGADAGAALPPEPGLRIPAEVAALGFFLPRDGETPVEYRERVLPVAQAAVEPQRQRVARLRDQFFEAAALDEKQRTELDAAVEEAADGIKNRVLEGLATGEILPPRLTPTSAVGFLRDLLDFVVKANRRFRSTLTEDQLATLADSRFDLADYLLFSVYWEEMLEMF